MACPDADPFEKDGHVYLYADKLQAHIVGALRERTDRAEVIAGLQLLGFERRPVYYGLKTHRCKRWYWRHRIGWHEDHTAEGDQ